MNKKDDPVDVGMLLEDSISKQRGIRNKKIRKFFAISLLALTILGGSYHFTIGWS